MKSGRLCVSAAVLFGLLVSGTQQEHLVQLDGARLDRALAGSLDAIARQQRNRTNLPDPTETAAAERQLTVQAAASGQQILDTIEEESIAVEVFGGNLLPASNSTAQNATAQPVKPEGREPRWKEVRIAKMGGKGGSRQQSRPGLGQSDSQAAAARRRAANRAKHPIAAKAHTTSQSSTKRGLSGLTSSLMGRMRQRRRRHSGRATQEGGPLPGAGPGGGILAAFGEMWQARFAAGAPAAADSGPAPSPAPITIHLAPDEAELLAARNISASDPAACDKLLNIPKVAIMFLVRGELHHEATWAAWFSAAAGNIPLAQLHSTNCSLAETGEAGSCNCSSTLARTAEKLCAPRKGEVVLRRQHLFNVYIHPLPSFGSYPEDSLFHGREIQERVDVGWGSHQLVDATRNLLRAALQDPLNQRFVQLSESCIPLYPPAAVHMQLLAEDRSRIDSCGSGRTDPWRYSGRMGSKIRSHWRKSSQWVGLMRSHAQFIVDDTELYPKFERYCHNAWDIDMNRHRDCFSDEHYFPSLLAYLQKGHETDCIGGLVSLDWSRGGAHPKTYAPFQVNTNLLLHLREKAGRCDSSALIRKAWDVYGTAGGQRHEADRGLTCKQLEEDPQKQVLGYDCPIFARKFPPDARNAVFDLLSRCDTTLCITNDGDCGTGRRIAPAASARRLLGMTWV